MDRLHVGRWAALLLLVLLGARARADCACVDWPPERWMAQADRVFVGRYKREPDSDGSKMYFDVLESLKGEVPERFQMLRSDDTCQRSFQSDELALVFVVHGKLPVCAGNFDLDKMMPTLGDYLTLAGDASSAPSMDAVQLALTRRVHGRKQSVFAPALAGQSTTVGGTRVSFVEAHGDQLLALSGTTRGALSFVALRSADGKTATWLLLARQHGRLSIVHTFDKDLNNH